MQPWWERSAFSQFTNPNANLFPTHPRRHSQERGDCHTEGLEPGLLTQGAGCQLPWRQATLSASLWPGLGDEACHPLPQMLYWKEWHLCPKVLVAQSCPTLCGPMDCSPPVSSPWDSPGKNTGVGCHALLQGIFQTRNQTRVSCTSGKFFTVWTTREAPKRQPWRWGPIDAHIPIGSSYSMKFPRTQAANARWDLRRNSDSQKLRLLKFPLFGHY